MTAHKKKRSILPAAALAAVAAVLFVLNKYGLAAISPDLLLLSRWGVVGGLAWYALFKRSLTTWIFVAMAAGTLTGVDFPGIAGQMKVLSLIFLRLIKTIIAPLIFATLVTGIAGHSSLKQVGRMGLKALIYFEVVTTLALFIGLAAINITKAGVGISLPPVVETSQIQKVEKQTVSEVIMHAFPENVA
ncbi:MAG TPA: cation:dicarboxylase symporter family transporter, partial [Elusimicrobiales bacterium]|nr:cation:dicarboxylase symporter family transporter [Elusimicrobiales bacterium]